MIISLEQLNMTFNNHTLFDIANLSILPKDIIYLQGKNGSGKTTLLKILAGLQRPSSGKIITSHQSLLQKFTHCFGRKNIIYLHQSPYLFDGSVYDNIIYGIKYKSLKSRIEQINTTIEALSLNHLIKNHVSLLSGGEKQRVALARAYLLQPLLLLLDEPSASLDHTSTSQLACMLQTLLDANSSVIITSHQQNQVTSLCNKHWHLTDKRIIISK